MDLRCFAPAAAFAALPEFGALIRLWLQRRGPAEVPDWSDVDFVDFRGWHAFLLLGRFDGNEPDPTLRMAGEGYIEMTKQNPRGWRISELVPRLYDLQFRDHFRRIRNDGAIGLTSGKVPLKGRGHVSLRILELPFRDGGSGVRRTLHALIKGTA